MSIRNFIFKVIFDLTVRVRQENFDHILKSYEKSQYFSPSDLEAIQLEKLKAIVKYARENSPYYSKRLPPEIRSLDDLRSIPLLDKETLRTQSESLQTNYGAMQRTKTSGGSTGAPVSIVKNSEGVAHEMAASWRGYSWAGVKVGDRQARFWGTPRSSKEKYRAKLIDFICHRIRITAFGYNDQSLSSALQRVNRFSPDYLYGYTSIIEELANYIVQSGQKPRFNLKSIITTSEVLSQPTRAAIEGAFNAKVFDEYGCGEIGTIAHECEHGSMHLNMENSIVEIIDENGGTAQPGESGEIVVTDLTNFSMPLIRYRLKDYGTISTKPCSCGRSLAILENIFGRQYDALVNSNGDKFHGEFFLYIAEDAKKIGHKISGIQFVQQPNRSILVNITPAEPNNELQEFISSRINNDFDKSFNIEFRWLDEIAREASGKLRVVKNESES